MDETINQNIMSGVYAILAVAVSLVFINTLGNNDIHKALPQSFNENAGDNEILKTREKPTLNVTGGYLELNQNFDPKDYVTLSLSGVDETVLKHNLKVFGEVDISKKGIYKVTYVLDYNEIVKRKEATFVVD